MSAGDSYSRDRLRQAYADAWRKHGERMPLTPLETLIADVIAWHPEYHPVIGSAAAAEFRADESGAEENPFLHMGLHIAVREQLSIDRPPGVRELHRRLLASRGDAHQAEHDMMQALGEALWEARRDARPPDIERYLALARRRLGEP